MGFYLGANQGEDKANQKLFVVFLKDFFELFLLLFTIVSTFHCPIFSQMISRCDLATDVFTMFYKLTYFFRVFHVSVLNECVLYLGSQVSGPFPTEV